jgi:hypothetical protein
MKTLISVHKQCVGRLQSMANNSDLFRDGNRPLVHATEAVELNDRMVDVPCEGSPGIIERLETYARGLSDAFNYVLGEAHRS